MPECPRCAPCAVCGGAGGCYAYEDGRLCLGCAVEREVASLLLATNRG